MFNKLLNFLYFNNHFNLATYSSKILSIFNSKYKKNIEILKFSEDKNMFIKTVCAEKNYTFKPKKNDLIIFNSYLEHSVNNTSSKQTDRISLPFDLIF